MAPSVRPSANILREQLLSATKWTSNKWRNKNEKRRQERKRVKWLRVIIGRHYGGLVERKLKNSTKVGDREWETLVFLFSLSFFWGGGGGWQSRRDAIKFRQRTSSSSSCCKNGHASHREITTTISKVSLSRLRCCRILQLDNIQRVTHALPSTQRTLKCLNTSEQVSYSKWIFYF